jgi:hypothetical protein
MQRMHGDLVQLHSATLQHFRQQDERRHALFCALLERIADQGRGLHAPPPAVPNVRDELAAERQQAANREGELNAEIQRLQALLAAGTAQAQATGEAFDSERARLAQAQQQFRDNEDLIARLQADQTGLRERLGEAEARAGRTEEQNQEAQDQVERLLEEAREEQAASTANIAELRTQIAAGEERERAIALQLKAAVNRYRKEEAKSSLTETALRSRAVRLDGQLHQEKEASVQLRAQIEEQQRAQQELRTQLEQAQRAQTASSERITELAGQLAQAEEQQTASTAMIAGLQVELGQLGEQRDSAKARANQAKLQHQEAQDQVVRLQRQLEEVQGELEQAQEAQAASTANIAELRTQIAAGEERETAMQRRLALATLGKAGLRHRVLRFRTELEDLREIHARCPRPASPAAAEEPQPLENRVEVQSALADEPVGAAAAAALEQSPFDWRGIPLAIREGNLSPLAEPENEKMLDRVKEALGALLERRDGDESVLHLAIYYANYRPEELRRDNRLFPALVAWAAEQSRQGRLNSAKITTLALALGDEGALCGPLFLAVQEADRFRAALAESDPKAWAQKLLASQSLDRSQKYLKERLQKELQAEAPAIPRNDISLEAQLRNPFNPKQKVMMGKGSTTEQDQGAALYEQRERIIAQAIENTLSAQSLEGGIRAFGNAADQPLQQTDSAVHENWLSMPSDALERDRRLGDAQRGAFGAGVQNALLRRLCAATGLGSEQEFAAVDQLARCVVGTGRLPPLLSRALSKGNRQELLVVAQLLYDYAALQTAPKQRYEEIALHNAWNWLTENRTPEDGAAALCGLMHECHQSHQFRQGDMPFAYPMTRNQAFWTQQIHNHMTGHKANPIYAEASAGKTSTAELAVRFCRRQLGIEKTVYFFSPFPVRVQDMENRLFQRGQRELHVDVDNAAVIVDEAHLFPPEGLVLSRNGRETAPLLMTATPIIPENDYIDFKRNMLAPRYRERVAEIERDVQQVDEAVSQALIARHVGNIDRLLPDCTKYLPLARGEFYKRYKRQFGLFISPMISPELRIQTPRNGQPVTEEEIDAAVLFKEQFVSWRDATKTRDTYPNLNNQNVAFDKTAQRKFNQIIQEFDSLIQLLRDAKARGVGVSLVQQNAENLSQLQARKRDLEQLQRKFERKIAKWEAAQDPNAEQYAQVREQKRRLFAEIDYEQRPKMALGEGAEFAAQQFRTAQTNAVQLIFPGVRFDEASLRELLSRVSPAVYRGERGENIETDLISKGTRFAMLYDETNMQGGDFEHLSFASPEGDDIDQRIYFNIDDRGTVTESDLLQALRRRRGTSALRPHVYGTQATKEEFLAQARRNQEEIEAIAARHDALQRIARKKRKEKRHPIEQDLLKDKIAYRNQFV